LALQSTAVRLHMLEVIAAACARFVFGNHLYVTHK
jgi:hypothetical protein